MTTKEVEFKDERLFDVRVVERNIRTGRITREEYEAHLKALADAQPRAEHLESEFVEGVLIAAAARQARRKSEVEEQIEDED